MDIGADEEEDGEAGRSHLMSQEAAKVARALHVQVLDRLLANLDDRSDMIAAKAQAGFETLVDALARAGGVDLGALGGQVLEIRDSRKGRFVALSSLCRRLGSRALLAMQPGLVEATLAHMAEDHGSCSSATLFLQPLLSQLRQEGCGQEEWRRIWVRPLIRVLAAAAADENTLANLANYGVSLAFRLGPEALADLLSAAGELHEASSGGTAAAGHAAAVVAVLKIAKRKGLFDALEQVVGPGCFISESLLVAALEGRSDSIRIDAMETICICNKGSSTPTPLEQRLAVTAVQLQMRYPVANYRNKWCMLLRKLLIRTKAGLEANLQRLRKEARGSKLQPKLPPAVTSRTASGLPTPPSPLLDQADIVTLQIFLQVLVRICLCHVYPGASHERRFVAYSTLQTLLELWPLEAESGEEEDTEAGVQPFDPLGRNTLLKASVVRYLLPSLLDSWTKLRELAMDVLMRLPSPLPGALLFALLLASWAPQAVLLSWLTWQVSRMPRPWVRCSTWPPTCFGAHG